MDRLLHDEKDFDLKKYSPLNLAFVGDAVFELMVREDLVTKANRPVGELHSMTVDQVRADAQFRAVQRIMPFLNFQELDVFRRGRNANTGNNSRKSSSTEYHYATGLEALLGYLYLSGQKKRLQELFEIIAE